uniref:X-prolyl aminopeptidase (aminopeptidase P) 2, membrane-bound n=1 Tax=Sander lucioperca TaxID=283035 RepID=A0A8D0A7G3_SANLU
MPSCGWLLLALFVAALTGNTIGVVAYEQTERNCSLSPPYLPSTAVNTTLQLKKLQEQMLLLNISAYIIPGTDAHLSEYIAPRDARMAFMTGFTGSAGTAVVTQTKAALWTDSRYWVQAERQMDCNWELEKDVSISSIAEWLISEVPSGDEIGFDPFLFSLSESLFSIPPVSPASSVNCHVDVNKIKMCVFAERPWQKKVMQIRDQIRDNPYEPTALLLSALDETAWLFNLRGNDIPYNPFFYSYTLLTMDEIWLFLHTDRMTDELRVYLNASCNGSLCVQLKSYDTVRDYLKKYVAQPRVKVWIGTEYTNYALYEIITPEVHRYSFSLYLLTICSAAIISCLFVFCSPSEESSRRLTVDEMYLVDSGGQYLDGTTDITRTVHWGTPTAMQKEAFTRVLMGNIEISRTIFPSGTRGVNMEMLGRRALWEVGLNYGHGTGHGVGNYFGVHECMPSFYFPHIFQKPGYYKENDFGIRIEDVAVIVPVHTKYGHNYLTFDTVSLVPYDRKLIDTSLLSSEQLCLFMTFIESGLFSLQLHWLNKYYETIRRLVGPELDKQGLHEEKDWMLKHTESFMMSGSSVSVCSSSLTFIALAVALLHNII